MQSATEAQALREQIAEAESRARAHADAMRSLEGRLRAAEDAVAEARAGAARSEQVRATRFRQHSPFCIDSMVLYPRCNSCASMSALQHRCRLICAATAALLSALQH